MLTILVIIYIHAIHQCSIDSILTPSQSITTSSTVKNDDINDEGCYAAQNGNLEKVKEILSKDPYLINHDFYRGMTLLHIASYNGRLDIVKFLLSNNADPNIIDETGRSPLDLAAFPVHPTYKTHIYYVEIVTLLLSHGADVNESGVPFHKPIFGAVINGHFEITKLLLTKGAVVNSKTSQGDTPLKLAIESNKESGKNIPKLLAKYGAHVDNIYEAAAVGDIEKVRAYIKHDPGLINKSSNYSCQPKLIHFAAKFGHGEVVKFLLSKGADIDAEDLISYTPLHYAAQFGQTDIIRLLIKKGANVNAESTRGETPLQRTLEETAYDHMEIVKLLLSHGAQVNVKTKYPSALYIASWGWNREIVSLLISCGADLHTKCDVFEMTPLHIAAEKGRNEIVNLLIKAGADVNARDKDGKTPLHYASSYWGGSDIHFSQSFIYEKDKRAQKYPETIEILLSNDADINAKDKNGETPLKIALKINEADIIETLRKHGIKE